MPDSLVFKLLCGFLLGVAAIFGVIVGFGSAEFVKTALTPRPETFTELYFENHLDLPKTVSPGQALTFTYTIHNVEFQPMSYPVTVWAEAESDPTLRLEVQQAVVALTQDQTQSVPVEMTVPDWPAQRVKVTIKLENLDQTIHFWMNLQNFNPEPTASSSPELNLLSQ